MMHSTQFCDSCGAAISDQTVTCPACGEIQTRVHALPALSTNKRKQPLPGTLLMTRYRIIEQVGEGGFGVVYKAQDRKRGRVVAIKQITLAALSPREIIDATDSYNRETTILPRLEHRNLPHLYDHFTDPEHWYIVMEYIEGQTLEEALAEAKDGRLPLKQVLKIARDLCDVLAYLHSQQPAIIFRDVKPGNIMLTRYGHVYLIDFGIARRYRAEQKRDTGALGSPGYAAPEQYGSSQSNTRTDIYGLGATLQTLLTGKEPTEGADIDTEAELPGTLKTLIRQMLEHNPDLRPHSMARVKEELETVKQEFTKQNKQRVSPFAWLAVLWALLYIPARNILFPGSISTLWFFILLIGVVGSILYSFYKEIQISPQPLRNKEMLQVINKSMQPIWKSLIYPFFWISLVGETNQQISFPNNLAFFLIWLGIYIFIATSLQKVPEWLRILQKKLSWKQQKQVTPPPPQMSQKP
jgi:serine/threonine protein kinase